MFTQSLIQYFPSLLSKHSLLQCFSHAGHKCPLERSEVEPVKALCMSEFTCPAVCLPTPGYLSTLLGDRHIPCKHPTALYDSLAYVCWSTYVSVAVPVICHSYLPASWYLHACSVFFGFFRFNGGIHSFLMS